MEHRFSGLATFFLASLLAGGAILADAPPTMDEAKQYLTGIQRNVTSANMRLRHGGISGLDTATADEPLTPADECCRGHIGRINEKIELLTKTFSKWDRHFGEQNDTEALDTLRLMRDQLNEVAIATAQFRMAVSQERAIQALQGLVPPYLALVRTTDELALCCPLTGPPETPKDDNVTGAGQ